MFLFLSQAARKKVINKFNICYAVSGESGLGFNKQKNIIEGKVKFITSIFEAKSLDLEDGLKEKIKTRINNAVNLSNKIIDEYKNKTTSAELKLMLINF